MMNILVKIECSECKGSGFVHIDIETLRNIDYKEIVEFLINTGADINAKTTDWYWIGDKWYSPGITVLMYAVSKGYKEIAEFLIEKGADVNVKTEDSCWVGDVWYQSGATALRIALGEGYQEIAKLLMKKGACNK